MAYGIVFSPAAARQLKKMDRSVLPQIVASIDGLIVEPRPRGCEKLSGYDDLYRVRVGDYRIVYGIEDQLVLVVVLKVGSRADIYQRIRESDLEFLRGIRGE